MVPAMTAREKIATAAAERMIGKAARVAARLEAGRATNVAARRERRVWAPAGTVIAA